MSAIFLQILHIQHDLSVFNRVSGFTSFPADFLKKTTVALKIFKVLISGCWCFKSAQKIDTATSGLQFLSHFMSTFKAPTSRNQIFKNLESHRVVFFRKSAGKLVKNGRKHN